MKDYSPGHGSRRVAENESAIRSYVARISALDGTIEGKRGPWTIKARSLESGPFRVALRKLPDCREGGQRRRGATAVQVLRVRGGHFRPTGGTRPRPDLVRAVLRAALQVLPPAKLPALRRRLAVDFDEVEREVDRRRVAQARADAEAVDAGLEERWDRCLVDRPGDEDLHILVAAEVELPAHLPDDRGEASSSGGRSVEPNPREVRDRLDREQGFRFLVVVRINEGDPRNLGLQILVDRGERLAGSAHDDDEGVRHRSHCGRPEQVGAEWRRNRVESSDRDGALDEWRDSRMHSANSEGEDLFAVRELPDSRRLRRDAARLADHPEQRRLI